MRNAYTLLELIGTMALVAVVAAVTGAGMARARNMARTSLCGVNVMQIGRALAGYLADWDQTPPTVMGSYEDGRCTTWPELIRPYLDGNHVFDCRAAPRRVHNTWSLQRDSRDAAWSLGCSAPRVGYALNRQLAASPRPQPAVPEAILASEGRWAEVDGADAASIRRVCLAGDRHHGYYPLLYWDFHYRWWPREQVLQQPWRR